MLLVLLDVEDLKQFGRVFRDSAVVDDALQLAGPGITDFCLRYDLDCHSPPGYVLAVVDITIRTAAAMRKKFQTVKFGGLGVHWLSLLSIDHTRRMNGLPAMGE